MKILIVDDEFINRALLANILFNAGYKDCIEAKNGREAIALFNEERPDLVLLDVVMPNMSGYDVAAKIRHITDDGYLPILFITALEDNESLVRCIEVGGNDFATKPFDKHILIAKIRAHLKIRSLSQHVESQNQRLSIFNQRVAREHAIVEHIFSHAIVNDSNVLAYFDTLLQPAETFNGDLFLCSASPSGGIYFIVGDFTGHGLASAIGALPVTRAFQELSRLGVSIPEIVSELNTILIDFLPSDMFMAAVIGEINAAGNSINLWQGGMPAVIVPANTDRNLRMYTSQHMALGILEEHELNTDCNTVRLMPNEQLLICSDGLIEGQNDSGEILLEEGLAQIVRMQMQQDGAVSANALYNRVAQYSDNTKFNDDVTIVVFTSRPIALQSAIQTELGLFAVHEVTLNAEHLKQPGILQRVLNLIGQGESVQSVRSIFYTVLSELFNNALEHGILNLNSTLKATESGFSQYYQEREEKLASLHKGQISIRIEALPTQNQVKLTVEDSGEGFQWNPAASSRPDLSYGRGLSLINALCDKIWFEHGGSKITCLLSTKAH